MQQDFNAFQSAAIGAGERIQGDPNVDLSTLDALIEEHIQNELGIRQEIAERIAFANDAVSQIELGYGTGYVPEAGKAWSSA